MGTKMVQIRDMNEEAVDVLKSRAAARGLSLSSFLRDELEALAARTTNEEILARLTARPRRHFDTTPTEVLREIRDGYEA